MSVRETGLGGAGSGQPMHVTGPGQVRPGHNWALNILALPDSAAYDYFCFIFFFFLFEKLYYKLYYKFYNYNGLIFRGCKGAGRGRVLISHPRIPQKLPHVPNSIPISTYTGAGRRLFSGRKIPAEYPLILFFNQKSYFFIKKINNQMLKLF